MSSAPHSQRPRDGSPPSRASPPRYYTRHPNIQPVRDSTIPPLSQKNSNSSESIYSDERSIFNAIRVSTPNEGPCPYESLSAMGSFMERGLGANMAMFIPPGYSQDEQSSTKNRRLSKPRPRVDRAAWPIQPLSDQGYHTSQVGPSPLNETNYVPESPGNQYRKAISLDAVDGDGLASPRKHPCWPGSSIPAAVRPGQPPYPPPERSPTPPGLPSFNTPEAVYCSSQFLIGHNGPRLPSNHPRGVPALGQRSTSYGDALRRFLGLQPQAESDSAISGVVGIGRAPDGTAVQGRFPHRQSGHGTNLARQIEDHPFHQNTLPVASASHNERDLIRARIEPESTVSKDRGPVSRPRKKRVRNMRFGIFGRTLIPASAPNPVQIAQQEPSPGPISPLQLPQPRYNLIGGSSDRRPEDETPGAEAYTIWDAIAWVPIQLYLCCCCVRGSCVDENDDLAIVNSRDTYATAQSRLSAQETRGENRPQPFP
ncbi:hypothetical protein N7520_001298 [Penicillium odoratum]|uniref:uncharacterized protein n=1 Tax=Penicillium odoratum TaxID=1167516 RepID=UPI00254982C6|nr:uncharacterized protein N7520_001298 [Penicillium odoratum]KAJ5778052.1 hypothetical protein N7520_001298 [Penicillium odoratum]